MSTIPIADAKDLALLFHLNSEPWLNQLAYDQPTPMGEFKIILADGPKVALPPGESTSLMELIKARYSCRNFLDQPLQLAHLAALLHGTYGTMGLRDGGRVLMHHRPVPSAGGIYPLELYVLVRSVQGIDAGLYHYAAWHHSLEPVDMAATMDHFISDMQEQFYVGNANAIVFLTAVFPRTMKKYGPRGYRYMLLEAGHAAQNLCLLAAEKNLATLCLGGFRDSVINSLLRLNPAGEGALYAIAVGQQGQAEKAEEGNAGTQTV